MTIRYGEHQFRLRVRDDGKGIAPEVLEKQGRAGHWGLAGIASAPNSSAGNWKSGVSRDSGTQVELSFLDPLPYGASPARHFRWFAKKAGTNS